MPDDKQLGDNVALANEFLPSCESALNVAYDKNFHINFPLNRKK